MGKHKNLNELKNEYIGKQFNWLTIIDVIKDNKYTWFKCRCICGNVKLINKYEVLRNKTISCGCNHKSEARIQQLYNNIEKLKEAYLNKTFGYLTIIDIYRDSKSAIIFKCQCTCGNIVDYNKFYIINNKIISCGCYKHSNSYKVKLSNNVSVTHTRLDIDQLKIKYINKVFNQLTVLDVIRVYDKHNKEKIMFKCQCTCGCIKNILKDRVLNNKTKSCGCYASSNDVISNMTNSLIQLYSIKRANINWQPLLDILHPDYFNDLLDGKLKTDSIIETKCPICNNYEKHALGNVYILSRSKFTYKINHHYVINVEIC